MIHRVVVFLEVLGNTAYFKPGATQNNFRCIIHFFHYETTKNLNYDLLSSLSSLPCIVFHMSCFLFEIDHDNGTVMGRILSNLNTRDMNHISIGGVVPIGVGI